MSLFLSETNRGPGPTPSAHGKTSHKPSVSPLSSKLTIHNLGVRENGTYYMWRHEGKAFEKRFEGLQLLILDLVGKRSTVQKILWETGQLDISPERTNKTLQSLFDLGILTIETICEFDEGRSWYT